MIKKVGLPEGSVILREARNNAIQHNKFMVLLKGQQEKPAEVWTGSTNISEGGIHGQTNVGHWVRDAETCQKFQAYWELLSGDPGGQGGEDRATASARNKALRTAVEEMLAPCRRHGPRSRRASRRSSARAAARRARHVCPHGRRGRRHACITLAFGINKTFKELLKDNKADEPNRLLPAREGGQAEPAAQGSVRQAQRLEQRLRGVRGSFINEPLYQWAKETNTRSCSSTPT